MHQVVAGRKRHSSSLVDCMADAQQQENRPTQRKAECNLRADCEKFLTANSMTGLVQNHSHYGPLGATFWWALAELNVTLAAFQHVFSQQTLLESHSFARCPKALAFEKLAFARGCTDMWHLQQSPHLQAISLVLETALLGCQDAAISQVTLRCPPFLAAWAARWLPGAGGADGSPPRIRLTVLQGYREGHGPLRATHVYNLGLPTITSVPAHTTIYVPRPP